MAHSDEYVQYRVVSTELGLLNGRQRVLVQASSDTGEVLTWTAQPSRTPRLGMVVEVNMRRPDSGSLEVQDE